MLENKGDIFREEQSLCGLLVVMAMLISSASEVFSWIGYGNDLNSICAPATPYIGDCTLCHSGMYSLSSEAREAYLSGGQTRIDFFCTSEDEK